MASGVLYWAVVSPWSMEFCQLPHMLPFADGFFIVLCTALIALVENKPIEDMLSAIVMCMQHTARISAVVTLIFIAS